MDALDDPANRAAPEPEPGSAATAKRLPRASRARRPAARKAVDLERYVPAFLTWIANKLSSGASQYYREVANVGIETWRCLVLLAIEDSISAQRVSKIIGMDKASVSRCFKSMQAKGLIKLDLDPGDGRVRIATLTARGRELHDLIMGIALERERALLSVLDEQERETLIDLLRRLHENLPAVERATNRYVAKRFPAAAARRHADDQGESNV